MKKTKNFITIIPLQPEFSLSKGIYVAQGNAALDVKIETRFPIINAIAGYAKDERKIKLTYILTNYPNAAHNYEAFLKPELDELSKRMGIEVELVSILTAYDQKTEEKLALFANIIEKLGNDEELYACITYGNKPTSQVLPMALNYAYRTKENVSVECVVYGEKDHETGEMRIYDTTSLFYMDSIVNKLAEHRAANPEKAIRLMLGLDETEDFDEE